MQWVLNATNFIIYSIILSILVISDSLYPSIKFIMNFCIENSEGLKGIRFFINTSHHVILEIKNPYKYYQLYSTSSILFALMKLQWNFHIAKVLQNLASQEFLDSPQFVLTVLKYPLVFVPQLRVIFISHLQLATHM